MTKRKENRKVRKIVRAIISCAAAGILVLPLSGCAVGAVMAGIGASKYGSSKQQAAYGEYRTSMEKINLEREKAGLEAKPILTFDEWRKGEK